MVLKNKFFIIVVISSILVSLQWFFKWSFEDSLFYYLLFIVLWVWYAGLALLSLIYLIKYRKWKPFIVIVSTLFILFAFDVASFYVRANFYFNNKLREKIIKDIYSRKLYAGSIKREKPHYFDVRLFNINDSGSLFPVTSTGMVIKINQCVFFPLFQHVQGIVYCNTSTINEFLSNNLYKVSKKFNNKWYWVTELTSSEKNKGQKIR